MDKATRPKDPAAVALGRKGGRLGGVARAAKLTAEERSESARKAVQARWMKAKKTEATKKPSDDAVLALLDRLKGATDSAEVKKLSAELERMIFHKQYKSA